jgi:hypothetical protein
LYNLNKNQNGVPTTTAIDNPWASGTNKIWLPSSGNLAGMAIVGTTDGLAKVVSNETFEGASSTATQGWTFASGTASTATGGTPSTGSATADATNTFALSFDGVNDVVTIPDNNSLDLSNQFTGGVDPSHYQ